MTKLEWVYKKAGKSSSSSRRRVIWLLAFVNDALRTKTVVGGAFSIMALSGKNRGGRGFLDLGLLKLELLDEFLHNQVDKCNLSSDTRSILKDVVDSHVTYRSKVGDDVDMMWMVTLPQSTKEFITLVGDRPSLLSHCTAIAMRMFAHKTHLLTVCLLTVLYFLRKSSMVRSTTPASEHP